jgi:hypothetical protein
MERSTAIEHNLAISIDNLPDVPCFVEICTNSESSICSYVPLMNREIAAAIISKINDAHAQGSLILLSSIECWKIGNKAAEVTITPHIYPLLHEVVLVTNSIDIQFHWQEKFFHHGSSNEELSIPTAILHSANLQLLADSTHLHKHLVAATRANSPAATIPVIADRVNFFTKLRNLHLHTR